MNVFRVILFVVIFSYRKLYYLNRYFQMPLFSNTFLIFHEYGHNCPETFVLNLSYFATENRPNSGRARIKFRHEKPISCNSSTWGISIFHSASIQSSILKSMFNQKKIPRFSHDILPLIFYGNRVIS